MSPPCIVATDPIITTKTTQYASAEVLARISSFVSLSSDTEFGHYQEPQWAFLLGGEDVSISTAGVIYRAPVIVKFLTSLYLHGRQVWTYRSTVHGTPSVKARSHRRKFLLLQHRTPHLILMPARNYRDFFFKNSINNWPFRSRYFNIERASGIYGLKV